MAKTIHVAGITSAEPQEVPGYAGTFPQPLKGSEHTEKEWLAIRDGDGNPIFEVRDAASADEGSEV